MITLGITGRSGCGKSTVTAVFAGHGVPLADADQISREILLPGSPLLPALAERFGADILKADGTLDRRLLADRAFATPEGKAALDGLTHPEIVRRIRAAKQVLRELDFITALPASAVLAAQGSARLQADSAAAQARVLVQGIADLVLVFDEHAEILDYKTDRSRDAQYYIDEYAAQLRLYRRAFAQRLAVPVTKLTIYSFAIEEEIDVPLG